MFGHEQFKPYQLSIQFLGISMALLEQLPKGNAHVHEQLKRAATSVSLNLAEGSGKMTNADKLRFYSIARGSAMECAALCDVISLVEPQLKVQAENGKLLLEEITRILTSVCCKK